MIGYILDTLGKKPCVINGGLLLNYTGRKGIPNIIYNQGDICVIEADESDGSIEKYHPYVALINNITLDHKPVEELRKLLPTSHGAPAAVSLSMPTAKPVLISAARTKPI